MSDLQTQLAILRKRIARIDRKYAADPPPPPPRPFVEEKPEHYFVEEWLPGYEATTPHGCHFETERVWERHRRHGSLDISSLIEMPPDVLSAISEGAISNSDCSKWAFLDTETTGLAGGSGTYAFLIGVGRITPAGFELRQFFMRDLAEETSLLHGLAEYLSQFETLVTYNGKTYDQPLLETRYRMARMKPPFSRMEHLDLLFGARRLWKLRFDSCRLVELENQILGFEREGDLPGAMIPYVYFEYLRKKEASRIVPILHHNAIDILTLACLTAIVPRAFQSPEEAPLTHGAEMVGLARWLCRCEQHDKALTLFRRALDKGLRDELMFRTMWDVARLERKLGREDAALAVYSDLASGRNPFRLPALEELAKYYEHKERNYSMALEFTLTALSHSDSDALRHRKARLERRVAKKASAASARLI
ncbi:MAG TPA: ribonuclease H-like domain-containing protein [Bryobacteraceae bacterium]|nr:ribonuclease H-like domain-containing protein [Bryobacteraceae bacterium]